jgi:hypothetical protein
MEGLFVPLLITLPLLAFWMWMFREMANNDTIPTSSNVIVAWPPATKNHWLFVFVILNVFGALYYYLTVYRKQ